MGNFMKKLKKPTPMDINFPEIQKKNWNISLCSEKGKKGGRYGIFLCLLKSGNILVLSLERDEIKFKTGNFLEIYTVPDLKLVEKYEYSKEIDDTIYCLDFAFQSKNGNIFTIGDKLYTFDGEEISKGPKEESEEINDMHFGNIKIPFCKPSDLEEKYPITKNCKIFLCDFLLEVQEGIFLYTDKDSQNECIFILDITKSKVEKNKMYYYMKQTKHGPSLYNLNIIKHSEYYPENLYICANKEMSSTGGEYVFESFLLGFNLEQFLKEKKPTKDPLFTIQISKSQCITGLCEYDKKYVLLDTYKSGIYIIDIELKQLVAVSVPKLYLRDSNSYYNEYKGRKAGRGPLYRKIIKLKDGQVLIENKYIADIRGQIFEEKLRIYPLDFEVSGDYLIFYCKDSSIYVFKISEEE